MEEDQGPEDKGTPAWVMTFADLMSLLMCFFVLLLAFSEMDVLKFKQLSGSMKEAFGVQADIKADYIPKGTSVVTQECAPGRPDKTTLDEIRQHTIDTSKSTLEFKDGEGVKEGHDDEESVEEDLNRLKEELAEEIEEGRVSLRREGSRIIIHIHEQGSFRSGYADVQTQFVPTLDKIALLVSKMYGVVQVTGHTDDVPISNARFRSNWELSAARAVSVAHLLMKSGDLDPQRMVVTGLASTQPRVDNSTPENRALNRRVEINVVRAIDTLSPADPTDAGAPAADAADDAETGAETVDSPADTDTDGAT